MSAHTASIGEATLTVAAKGQITLRKDLLQHLGIQAGSKITVHKLPNGRIEIKAARPAGKISDAFGFAEARRAAANLHRRNERDNRQRMGRRAVKIFDSAS